VGTSCGYIDDNPRAASKVAQAYLNAFTERDPDAICRVLAPEAQLALAAGKTCEEGVAQQLARPYPLVTVGDIRPAPSPFGNPRFAVDVPAQPGRAILVGRYGSIWRVIDGGRTR
jgi:hypothetical protein